MGGHDVHDFGQNTSLAVHLSHAGLLPSHVYFGSCFFVLGAWWLTTILRAQYRQGKRNEVVLAYTGKCGSCSGRLIEGLLKLIVCIIGIVIEAITVKSLGRPENYTYNTIYVSFMLAAVLDILSALRVVLPDGIDFLAHAIGFANLGILARSQAWGHMHLTVATRMLTSYVATFTSIILLIELYKPQSQVLKFIRTGAVMLQGVWFWHAGVVLDSHFSERWTEEDHANLLFITIAFSWDMCGVVLLQIFFAVIMEKIFGSRELEIPRHRLRANKQNGLPEAPDTEATNDYKPLQAAETL